MGVWRGIGNEIYTPIVRTTAVSGEGHRFSVVAAGPVEQLVCFPRDHPRHSPLAERRCKHCSPANRLCHSPIAVCHRRAPIIAINSFVSSLSSRQFVVRFASVVSHQLSWMHQGCLRSFPSVNGSSRRITTVYALAIAALLLQYT